MKGYRDGLTQLSASSMHSPQPSAEVLDSWVPSVQLVDAHTFNITFAGIFARSSHLRRCWGPSLGEHPF